MLKDKHNRAHNYLRISLTDNCNMRCFYCMPDDDYEFTPLSKLMQSDEIIAIAKTFVSLGINKIRLTGGEPLVRKDVVEIITGLSKLPVKLTLTTNGSRLHDFIGLLEQSGVNTLNVSLDTLQRDKFMMITKRDQFELVKNNIELLLQKNFHVKINMVVMKGMNENEINDFVSWTKHSPVHVRFIEFMPFEGNRWTSNKVFTLQEILDTVRSVYEVETLQNDVHDTSKAFKVPGYAGTFAVISTMSEPFCSGCNRIRLTADGKIKNCLFSREETDLLAAFRNKEDILPLITQSIKNKAAALGGQMNTDFEHLHPEAIVNRSMIT
ncbi:MAG: GTP 3',8-cyclase MoaA, partial [Ferruginibacter sp.]